MGPGGCVFTRCAGLSVYLLHIVAQKSRVHFCAHYVERLGLETRNICLDVCGGQCDLSY